MAGRQRRGRSREDRLKSQQNSKRRLLLPHRVVLRLRREQRFRRDHLLPGGRPLTRKKRPSNPEENIQGEVAVPGASPSAGLRSPQQLALCRASPELLQHLCTSHIGMMAEGPPWPFPKEGSRSPSTCRHLQTFFDRSRLACRGRL